MTKMSYDEAVSFIHGRRKFTKDPSLVKMRRMAELMGNPQKKLKLIHVTGTNGKGSVTAYLRELLMSHGYRVGRSRLLLSSGSTSESQLTVR